MPPRNVHTLGNGSSRRSSSGSPDSSRPSLVSIWNNMPPVTRSIALLLCLVSSLYVLQIIEFGYLLFQWNETYRHYQLWRLVTSCMILPGPPMQTVMVFYNIFSISYQLETEHFFMTSLIKPPVDYTFYLCFCIIFITNAVGILFGPAEVFNLTGCFSSCLTFTWAIDNINNKVMFYGIIPIYGKYYPILTLGISLIFGEANFLLSLLGMSIGYIFLCLDTHSFGTIWGLIARKHPTYGRAPGGKFGAPNWFVTLYDTIFRTTTPRSRKAVLSNPVSGLFKSEFQGSGSKLGGGSTKKPSRGEKSRVSRGTPSAETSGASTATETGNFKGMGQRLGAKKE